MLRTLKLSDYAAGLPARPAPKPEGIPQAGAIAEMAQPLPNRPPRKE